MEQSAQPEIHRLIARLVNAIMVMFLLLVPLYLFTDELISNRGYSFASRFALPIWSAYFVVAGLCLAALPKIISMFRPFQPRTSFVLYGLCLASNIGALLLVVAEAK